MGRKQSRRDETRTKIVSARLTQDTFDIISAHAERLGLTRAGYVEHLIENRPLKIVRGQMDELTVPLINELKRIGNNLNQIAHARNAGADIDPSHFHTVLADIIRVICRNELTRKHYADAYTEVVGEDRDDAAVDPAKRSMPAPLREVDEIPWSTRGHQQWPSPARPEDVSNDNPPPRQAPPWHQDQALPLQQPVPWSSAPILHSSIPPPPPPPQPDAPPPHMQRSPGPNSRSAVRRHDPSPPSAWSKLLRRLRLRSP